MSSYSNYLIDSGYYDPPDEETPCVECDGNGRIKSTNPERDKAWEVPCPACSKRPCEMCAGSKWKSACPECDGAGYYAVTSHHSNSGE